jgi:hypothetical protein
MNFVKIGRFTEACRRTVRVYSRPKILGALRECQQCFCEHIHCQSVSHRPFAKCLLELNILEQKS